MIRTEVLTLCRALYSISVFSIFFSGTNWSQLTWGDVAQLPLRLLRLLFFVFWAPFRVVFWILNHLLPKKPYSHIVVAVKWLHRAIWALKMKARGYQRAIFLKRRAKDVQDEAMLELGNIKLEEHYVEALYRIEGAPQDWQSEPRFQRQEQRLERLRLLTCKSGDKGSCRGCGSQICSVGSPCSPKPMHYNSTDPH